MRLVETEFLGFHGLYCIGVDFYQKFSQKQVFSDTSDTEIIHVGLNHSPSLLHLYYIVLRLQKLKYG